MALGFPNSNGGRTTDSALFHALGNAFVGSWISGFRVRQASPVGMNVLIGGESGIPDDLLVRDAMSATFPVSNLSTQPVQASVTTANSANPRIDAVVIYIDTNVAASQTVANNENRTKAVVVPGTPATNPSAPTPSQIKAKIGASNPYEVIAEIRVNAGTTTILDSVITDRRNPATLADGRINRAEIFKNGVIGSDALGNDIVLPRHMALLTEQNTIKEMVNIGYGLKASVVRVGQLVFLTVGGTTALPTNLASLSEKMPDKFCPASFFGWANLKLTARNSGKLSGTAIIRISPTGIMDCVANSGHNEWYGTECWFTDKPAS